MSLRSPRQEFCSPPFISSFCRRALPSHSLGSWGHVPLGVQGEREVGADGERKGEELVLTCQRMAEVHALGSQRGIHGSHFLDLSESRKSRTKPEHSALRYGARDIRSKCVLTMSLTQAGQWGAVGTKSGPHGPPRTSGAPKRAFWSQNGPFWGP